MDNVTHSLAGLLLAEAAVRLRARRTGAEPSPRFRSVAAIASMIAANLPDSDLLYTGVGGDRLGYMLHHRGHTHTVIVAVLGAVLLWGAAALALRRRAGSAPVREGGRWLLALLLASSLGHLALDATNSYGVHPFWPLDDRWYYGDAVFIVEPWLWVVTVPALVAASTSRVARALLAAVLLLGLALAWRVDLVSPGAAAALTAGAALSTLAARLLRPDGRVVAALVGWLIVTLVMATGSARARATATRAARAADPAAELLDVIVSPLPANPLCVAVITIERTGRTYRVSTARASSVPSIAVASRCASRNRAGPAFGTSPRPATAAMQWDAEWTAPSEEIVALVRESCHALAAMRFIRAPIWRALGDSSVMLGDVRYGGGSGSGFTDVVVPRRPAACPAGVPPWAPPRADLLGL